MYEQNPLITAMEKIMAVADSVEAKNDIERAYFNGLLKAIDLVEEVLKEKQSGTA